MASGPITSWQIDGEIMETVTDFIFLGSIITANVDCSHEIKRHLFLGRKAMTNLDSILKSRDITLPTKVHLVKAMVFPVVMYGCESWSCWIELLEFFIYFEYYPLIRNMVCKYFFHYIDYHFILLIIFFAVQKVFDFSLVHSPSAGEPVPEQRAPGKCSVPRPGSPVPSTPERERGCGPVTGKDREKGYSATGAPLDFCF